MEQLMNLKLVEKEMDTSLAEEFIKNNNPCEINFSLDDDDYYSNIKITKIEIYHIAQNLAMKVEENTEMFAQLEYLARGTDRRDVTEGHIKIMSQYIRCCNALWIKSDCHYWAMDKDAPLFCLAFVAYELYHDVEKVITTPRFVLLIKDKSLFHICLFFVQLCKSVGFPCKIRCDWIEPVEINSHIIFFNSIHNSDGGCTGVITGGSDLDSAICTFVQSSKTAPWRLERVYVEETIFEDFKNTLSAIAQSSENGEIVVGDKIFMIELLETKPGVKVEAYRTTKELLSMIATPFLSIWAADCSLSNEIAIKSGARTIWVNDYASFDGPPRAALSLYKCPTLPSVPDTIKSILDVWSKMTRDERMKTIVHVLETTESQYGNLLLDKLLQCDSGDFVHVTDKTICFGIPQQSLLFPVYYLKNDDISFNFITSLLNGNGIVRPYDIHNGGVIKDMKKAGVPIISDHSILLNGGSIILEELKVIRTNHGTIFAN